MSGTIFSICVISAISAQFAALSSASCPQTMAKRMQQGHGEELIVAQSKPTLNLVTKTEASSSTLLSPNASNHPGILRAPIQKGLILQEGTGTGDPNQNDAASSSQVWQKDAERDERTRRLVATGTNQDLLNFRECSESTRRLVALMAKNSESIDGNDAMWPHNFHISTAYVPHLKKVFSSVRQKFGRKLGGNGRSRCKYVDMENIYDRHSSSRSSSWKRFMCRITFYQKSA